MHIGGEVFLSELEFVLDIFDLFLVVDLFHFRRVFVEVFKVDLLSTLFMVFTCLVVGFLFMALVTDFAIFVSFTSGSIYADSSMTIVMISFRFATAKVFECIKNNIVTFDKGLNGINE